jgi:hypothetical protein
MDNKTYKTSQERRNYQREYYKVRMDKQKELECKLKISGGDILAQKINENVDEIIDSDDDYKIEPVNKQKISLHTFKPKVHIEDIKPKINKEQIVNFKFKKAISWISQNVQKDAEQYIEDLGDQLGYNIETIEGLNETLKVAEMYFERQF